MNDEKEVWVTCRVKDLANPNSEVMEILGVYSDKAKAVASCVGPNIGSVRHIIDVDCTEVWNLEVVSQDHPEGVLMTGSKGD